MVRILPNMNLECLYGTCASQKDSKVSSAKKKFTAHMLLNMTLECLLSIISYIYFITRMQPHLSFLLSLINVW